MKVLGRQKLAILKTACIVSASFGFNVNTVLAEDSFDFDVDQLIANEKAWSIEQESAEPYSRPIKVTLIGSNNDSGFFHVLAYDDPLAFRTGDYQNAVGYLKIPATSAAITVDVNVASADEVALFAYHDENSDEILNKRNQIPEEAYGFSDAINPYLQPSFSEAAFSKDSITIRLVSMPKR